MMPLSRHIVLATPDCADSALSRFFSSMGAQVRIVEHSQLLSALPQASFLIDRLGTNRLASAGVTRNDIERANARLVHVSVTPFGSDRAAGCLAGGSELIALRHGRGFESHRRSRPAAGQRGVGRLLFSRRYGGGRGCHERPFRTRPKRTWATHRCIGAGSRIFTLHQQHSGVAIRSEKAASRGWFTELRACNRALHLAAAGWMVLSYLDDWPVWRPGQSSIERMDGRGRTCK